MNNTIYLDYGLPGLNEIIRAAKTPPKNGVVYAKMKKKYTNAIADEMVIHGCVPDKPFDEIDIRFIWGETRAHRRDPDNIRAGSKFVLDAMVHVGIIPNDTSQYIGYMTDHFVIHPKKRCVTISWNGRWNRDV
ncbi:hypothetical protein J7J13_03100 [bacterium]|nr:hypothetical protein [bacterium]